MKKDKDYYDLHVLVCTNEKKHGGGCGPKGGQELVDKLKAWSKENGLKKELRINKSGCLGRCEDGIVCVAYPKAEWLTEVDLGDEKKVEEWILKLTQDE
jgi:predicted metal-binding protein